MYLERPVKYTDDIIGDEAQKEIKELKKGEVLVLNNVRMLEEENKEGYTRRAQGYRFR